MSHQYPPLILLLKEDDHLSFIEKFIQIFNLNLDTSYLKIGKQIKITRITSAPLRRGVGGDVMIYVASTTAIIKVKPPLGTAPLLPIGTK